MLPVSKWIKLAVIITEMYFATASKLYPFCMMQLLMLFNAVHSAGR